MAQEYRRLVEKWLYEGLSAEELNELPQELKDRTQGYFKEFVDKAYDDVNAGRIVDGPTAMKRLRSQV